MGVLVCTGLAVGAAMGHGHQQPAGPAARPQQVGQLRRARRSPCAADVSHVPSCDSMPPHRARSDCSWGAAYAEHKVLLQKPCDGSALPHARTHAIATACSAACFAQFCTIACCCLCTLQAGLMDCCRTASGWKRQCQAGYTRMQQQNTPQQRCQMRCQMLQYLNVVAAACTQMT